MLCSFEGTFQYCDSMMHGAGLLIGLDVGALCLSLKEFSLCNSQ